ncbi:MAG: ABC transporter ATP-binding protein [Alphaproteobacteria bacterium]|nr:ABC transporter ATP-binding protein [Alphaproteobacteria bacterium]
MTAASDTARDEAALSVGDLRVRLRARAGIVHAVNGISFAVRAGEIVGIVGESGSGKSVAMMATLGLLDAQIVEQASGLVTVGARTWRDIVVPDPWTSRSPELAIVFQDAIAALNPVLTVGAQMTDALAARHGLATGPARARARELLDAVRIADAARVLDSYPHQLSGGMCQRVMIAIAISAEPKVLVADEPTTALDVTVQAQILDLLRRIRDRTGMAIVIISHDLGVIARMASQVYVMYAGRIVESAPAGALFADPRHPYSRALLQCSPRIDRDDRASGAIPGAPPDMRRRRPGCAFAPRCTQATARCGAEEPALIPAGVRSVACWHPVGGGRHD